MTQITIIRNERGNIDINLIKVERVIKEYCEQMYTNKLHNLG